MTRRLWKRVGEAQFEECQPIPDGSRLWLQTNKLPMRNREEKVAGVIGTYEDITARKRAENELRQMQFSLEMLRTPYFG